MVSLTIMDCLSGFESSCSSTEEALKRLERIREVDPEHFSVLALTVSCQRGRIAIFAGEELEKLLVL